MNGDVYFDDVALRPALAVHRSQGRGRFQLGSGEILSGRRYTAVHHLDGPGSCDTRFLDSYTASFSQDRWVLDGVDEVIYHHEVSYFGVPDLVSNVRVSPRRPSTWASTGRSLAPSAACSRAARWWS